MIPMPWLYMRPFPLAHLWRGSYGNMSSPYFSPTVLRVTLSNGCGRWGMIVANGILQISVCSYTSRSGFSQAKRILLKSHCSQCQGQAVLQLTKQVVGFISPQAQSPRKQLLGGYFPSLLSGHHLESLRLKPASSYFAKCCVRWRVDGTSRVLLVVSFWFRTSLSTCCFPLSTVSLCLPSFHAHCTHSLLAETWSPAVPSWRDSPGRALLATAQPYSHVLLFVENS